MTIAVDLGQKATKTIIIFYTGFISTIFERRIVNGFLPTSFNIRFGYLRGRCFQSKKEGKD